MKLLKFKVLAKLYSIIRPLFVINIDPNEDFSCGWCGKPVLRRIVFCSSKCEKEDFEDAKWLDAPLTEKEKRAIENVDENNVEPW